jgi:hypothetical protein
LAAASTITSPYSDNYTTYTSGTAPANVTISDNGSNWTLATATNSPAYNNGNYSNLMPGNVSTNDSAYQASNLSPTSGATFFESTAFTLGGASNSASVGLFAFGASANSASSSGNNNYLVGDINTASELIRLFYSANGSNSIDYDYGGLTAALNNSDTYVETLTGSMTSGTSISLTISLTDSTAGTTLGTYTQPFTRLSNLSTFFGLRDSNTASGNPSPVYYLNYSLSPTSIVPEPTSLSLAGLSRDCPISAPPRHSVKHGRPWDGIAFNHEESAPCGTALFRHTDVHALGELGR